MCYNGYMLEMLDDKKKYLVAVSGGCDSMMLLALCAREKKNAVAAFVNYGLRESAEIEEKLVTEFCRDHDIPLEKLHPVQEDSDNFQMWAREVRYDFFRSVYDRYECDALLTGHQLDDHLENYLMAKERGSQGWYYGIAPETFHHGMKIIRPLLNLRKSETRLWCETNGIPFHDDESNFTDHYTRNEIRHRLIEPADDQQINTWLREIEELNAERRRLLETFEREYAEITLTAFRREERQEELLRWLIWRKQPELTYSTAFLQDCLAKMKKSRGTVELKDGLQLVWEKDELYFFRPGDKYELLLNEIAETGNEHVAVKRSGLKIEGLKLGKDDFPVRIRCWKAGDQIKLRNGHKKVSRFLIDRKIPYRDRYYWPVVENKKGTVVFVSGIGCDVDHYDEQLNMYLQYYPAERN